MQSSQSDHSNISSCDVLVIGGGPAGSTISALLAERGYSVVMLEKSKHPRFHIGESLLPLNMPLLEKLGVSKEVEMVGMPKYGVEFVSPWHKKSVFFNFSDAWDKDFPSAYQVRRSEFDEILFRNAERKGATTLEECKVTNVEFNSSGATITSLEKNDNVKTWNTKFVVDASGRDTFLANRFDTKKRNKKHNSAAIFGHFTGATRLPGELEGNISLFWFDHGWFWFIPLSDGSTSVGAVCWPYYMQTRKTPPDQFLMETIALCPALEERLKDAKLISPVTATGNYSYKSTRTHGENYLMIGDAFAFIDPVFSSGVFLAMQSAFTGAETISTCLSQPEKSRQALKTFDKESRRGPHVFSWFIYRVTTPTLRDLFMNPRNDFRLQEALLSVLAGDIFRGTPIRLRLLGFKIIYYLHNLFDIRRTVSAWKRRKRIIQEPVVSSR